MVDYREEVRARQADPGARGRGVSQDPQHLPLPAGEPVRLRSGGGSRAARPACRRSIATRCRATRDVAARGAGGLSQPTTSRRSSSASTSSRRSTCRAFYADVSKDRLYTFAAASPERRSAQTAMYMIADGLVAAARADPAGDRRRAVAPPAGHARGVRPPGGVPGGRRDRRAARRRRSTRRWERLKSVRDQVNARARSQRARTRRSARRSARGSALRAGGDDRARCSSSIAPSCRCSSSCRRSRSTPAAAADGRSSVVGRARRRREVRALLAGGRLGSRPDAGTEGLCDRCVGAIAATA